MCPYEERLTAWLLGDLSRNEQEAVARHLDSCETCRALRDELTDVLTPLQSGLAKDRHLSPDRKRVPPGHWLSRVGAWTFNRAPWLRAAALILVSIGALFALMSLYYRETCARAVPVGPVTTFTFYKPEQPPEPLEPLKPLVAAKADELPPLVFDAHVSLPLSAGIVVPDIPTHDFYFPHFYTFAPILMWSPSNSLLIIEQLLSAAATNSADALLMSPPPINAQPR